MAESFINADPSEATFATLAPTPQSNPMDLAAIVERPLTDVVTEINVGMPLTEE